MISLTSPSLSFSTRLHVECRHLKVIMSWQWRLLRQPSQEIPSVWWKTIASEIGSCIIHGLPVVDWMSRHSVAHLAIPHDMIFYCGFIHFFQCFAFFIRLKSWDKQNLCCLENIFVLCLNRPQRFLMWQFYLSPPKKTRSLDLSRVRRHFQKKSSKKTDKQFFFFKRTVKTAIY